MILTGRTIAVLEAAAVAAILPAADVLLQAVIANGFDAIDLKQVGAAAVVGGLTYLVGFLRALPLTPSGQTMPVTTGSAPGATNTPPPAAPTPPPASPPAA